MEPKITASRPNIRTQQHDNVTWVDVEHPTAQIFTELENKYHLHPVHLKESVQQVQHSQVEQEEQYLFFVLHTPIATAHKDKILIDQVGIFLGKNFLVTVRTGKVLAVSKLFDDCENQTGLKEDYFKKGSAYLLHILINNLLTDIFDMTESVVSELDSIEDLVFDSNASDAQRIGKVRQKIVRLGRIIGPKKLILEDLTQQVNSFTGQSMSRYFSNNTKTVSKLWEVIEEAKETVEIYKDADFTTSTERTNQILAVLTLIFTFTIPVTIAGALYGMNVLLPGGISAGSWKFLGDYTTFGLLLVASILAAIVMYVYFKRKKWF